MTTAVTNTMKLSKQTYAILKSMAGINSNLHVLPGNKLVCLSRQEHHVRSNRGGKLSNRVCNLGSESVSRNAVVVQRSRDDLANTLTLKSGRQSANITMPTTIGRGMPSAKVSKSS